MRDDESGVELVLEGVEAAGRLVVGERSVRPGEHARMTRRVHAYVNALGEAISENKVLKRRLARAQDRMADLLIEIRELRSSKVQ